MKILFLLPEIHQLATGGNVYNRKLLQFLSDFAEIKTAVVHSDSLEINNREYLPDFIFVDSLLLQHQVVNSLKNKYPATKFILLAHYLKLLDPKNNLPDSPEIECLPLMDKIITSSNYSKEKLVAAGISARNITVAYPGVEPDFFMSDRSIVDKETVNLLTISSLFPGKGLLELIDVLKRLLDYKWQWTLIGEDQLDLQFRKQFFDKLWLELGFNARIREPFRQ